MKQSKATHHGLLLLNKSTGISSHAAVDLIRELFAQKAVGHAGTLDPAAEGLLVLMLGNATKAAPYLTNDVKEYEAEIRLGVASPTYDREGVADLTQLPPAPSVNGEQLRQALGSFRGTITQKVPPFSAVHVDGERLYKKSRKGEFAPTPERTVTIETLELLSYESGIVHLRVICSKGTYIRSLAHDLGQQLGCGGYLAALRRTRSGRFRLDEAFTLEQLQNAKGSGTLTELLIPLDRALGFSALTVTEAFYDHALNGQRPRARDIAAVQGEFRSGDHVLLNDARGCVLAIATAMVTSDTLSANPECEVLRYERVLP